MPYGAEAGQGYQNPVNTRVIVVAAGQGTGLFVYDPAPGLDNLIVSIVGPTTSDPYGNAVISNGIEIQGAGDTGQKVFLGLKGTAAVIRFPSGSAYEGTAAELVTGVMGTGAAQFIQMFLQGPAINVAGHLDSVQVVLNSPNEGGTSSANGDLGWTDNAGSFHDWAYWDSSGFHIVQLGQGTTLASGFAGNFELAQQSQTTAMTITTAGYQPISASYGINANDAVVGSEYEIEIWGGGAQGAALQTISFAFNIGVFSAAVGFPAAMFTASQSFRWRARGTLYCAGPLGASCSWIINIEVTVTNLTAPTSANSNTLAGSAAAQVFSSAATNFCGILVNLGAASAGLTITGSCSHFRRIY
jgi:hypothetical protein